MPSLTQLAAYADARTFAESMRGHSKGAWLSTAPTAVPATANVAVPAAMTVDARSHFFATGIVGWPMQGAGAATPNALLNFLNTLLGIAPVAPVQAMPQVQIVDEGSQANFFDRPVFWSAIVGDAERPFPLVPARFLRAGSRVRVDFFQTAGAVAFTLQLALKGTKVYLV